MKKKSIIYVDVFLLCISIKIILCVENIKAHLKKSEKNNEIVDKSEKAF